MSVCLSVMLLTLVNLDVESSFWCANTCYVFRIIPTSRSSSQGQDLRTKNVCLYIMFTGGLKGDLIDCYCIFFDIYL